MVEGGVGADREELLAAPPAHSKRVVVEAGTEVGERFLPERMQGGMEKPLSETIHLSRLQIDKLFYHPHFEQPVPDRLKSLH